MRAHSVQPPPRKFGVTTRNRGRYEESMLRQPELSLSLLLSPISKCLRFKTPIAPASSHKNTKLDFRIWGRGKEISVELPGRAVNAEEMKSIRGEGGCPLLQEHALRGKPIIREHELFGSPLHQSHTFDETSLDRSRVNQEPTSPHDDDDDDLILHSPSLYREGTLLPHHNYRGSEGEDSRGGEHRRVVYDTSVYDTNLEHKINTYIVKYKSP